MSLPGDRLIDLLRARYREDPQRFREYLPGAAELLPEPPPGRQISGSPPGLTEAELSHHRGELAEALRRLDDGGLAPEGALDGLRHCAALIRADSLHYGWDESLSHEMGYEVLKSLVRAAIGKSPGSYGAKTTVPVGEGDGPAIERVSVIRGVYLDFDAGRRLVSVSIHPGKYRSRRKLMAIVGIGSDPNADVALRHDEYLTMQNPHGHDG